ncbi:MAG TPA: RNA polymerase sigma factor [Polyangiaceae bacterium]|nr:RNA polymerase sigma factor [Polyangiaceae bacterium]
MTFEELYDTEFEFVWRTLRRLGVPEADLPDVVQEVFLVVHRRLSDFEGRSKVTTWLFRIAMGVARDRRRKAHVRRELLDPNVFDSVADPAPDATQELERRDDLALFDSALDGLDLDQRAVFALFELEGMSGQDIATTLQIPLGTVYSRLRLARIAFRSNLKRHAARAQWQRLQVGERT